MQIDVTFFSSTVMATRNTPVSESSAIAHLRPKSTIIHTSELRTFFHDITGHDASLGKANRFSYQIAGL